MPLLAAGAGASEGLDTILARLMAEEKLAQESQKITEDSRHNRATEANTAESIRELGRYRTDAQQERVRETIRQQAMERPIGAPVTESEMANETGPGGVPSGLYSIKPGAKVSALSGFSTAPGSVSSMTGQGEPRAPINGKTTITEDQTSPMNAPRSITNAGTEAQQVARLREQNTGVNSQKETVAVTDPELAKALGLKVGDPIDANREPRSQRVMFRGMDVTDKTGHWERPPAPDRALILSGAGYLTREEARRRLMAGQNVDRPFTTNTLNRMETGAMTAQKIPYVEGLAERLDQEGLFGPVMSRLRTMAVRAGSVEELAAMAGNDPELQADGLAGEFSTALPLLASGIAITHYGGNAGRSAASINMFRDLFSDAGTIDLFKGKLKGADSFITTYANGPKGAELKQLQTPQPNQGGGLPKVGEIFNGGRVLSVTPVQ